MNWKIFGIIAIILLLATLGYAVYVKIVAPSESQKAKEITNINYTFEPHFGLLGGCARYNAPSPEVKK